MLLSKATHNKSIFQKKEEQQYISVCLYSKNVHRTKCKIPTIARLTHSPSTTRIVRMMEGDATQPSTPLYSMCTCRSGR